MTDPMNTGEGEPTRSSGSLFGRDGTDLPEPMPVLPDPLNAPSTRWRQNQQDQQDQPELPQVPLPPAPDAEDLRRAIAIALGEEPDEPEAEPGEPDASAQERSGASSTASAGGEPSPAPGSGQPSSPPAERTHPGQVLPPRRPLHPVPPPYGQRHQTPRTPEQSSALNRKGVGSGCVIMLIFAGLVAYQVVFGVAGALSALLR